MGKKTKIENRGSLVIACGDDQRASQSLFLFFKISSQLRFAVVAPVGVVKVCGAEDRRRRRLGLWGAVKGEPGGRTAGFDAEAHL